MNATTMQVKTDDEIMESYRSFLSGRDFPCVAAREAVAREQVHCFVAGHMACPAHDRQILDFLYSFVDQYREKENLFHSAAIIFKQPFIDSSESFDGMMWMRLQALADLDAEHYGYDRRVTSDPNSENFSFSLKEEAFFIVGLHPESPRKTRRFNYAALAFNPHSQFDRLRSNGQYQKMQNIVRKRDLAYSGSINPMLRDFGTSSEVFQYSGREYGSDWSCPLKINHGTTTYHSAEERGGLPAEKRPAS